MSPLLRGGGSERKRCTNCGRMVDADRFWRDSICEDCGSGWTQRCPRCGSTAIAEDTRKNPSGYASYAGRTVTIWECEGCGFRSRFSHDWRWE